MSRECPVTHATCHNPECFTNDCVFRNYPFERGKEGRKKVELGDMVIKALADQAAAIERLTRETEEHHHRKHPQAARFFGIELAEGKNINSISYYVINKQKHMPVSFKQAGGATATLTPLAADGVTPAPNGVDLTKPVTAVSSHPEFFTATVVVDTNGAPTLPLQVTLKGVADGVGTITYGATSIDGTALTLVDNVTVADVPPIVPAESFTVAYTTF